MASTAVNMSNYTGPSAFSSVALTPTVPPSTPIIGTSTKRQRIPLKTALELIQLSKNRKNKPVAPTPPPFPSDPSDKSLSSTAPLPLPSRNKKAYPTQQYTAKISPVIPDQIVITTSDPTNIKRGIFTIKNTDNHKYSITRLKQT
jgi:hypothetical protein